MMLALLIWLEVDCEGKLRYTSHYAESEASDMKSRVT